MTRQAEGTGSRAGVASGSSLQPPESGPRLTFEALRPDHTDGLFAALADPRVGRYIGGPDFTTMAELRARIDRLLAGPGNDAETWLNWVVLLEGTIIGRIEATLHDGVAEIGYVFGPRWWGRGLGSEAVAWLLSELWQQGVPEAWASVDPDNEASIRLLRHVGFDEAQPSEVVLHSYVPGDRVFVHR
jgi:RimJ/RimL family protein N-acetyltransferase